MSAPTAGPSTQTEHSRAVFRNTLRGEDAYARHQRYVRDYINVYGPGKSAVQARKTDFDVLKAAHKFIRDENEDLSRLSYDDQLAVKYYTGLFKEFVICDLKHYKTGQIALRWRVDSEVIDGVGQFTCANPRCAYHLPLPDSHSRRARAPRLQAYELPFAYVEQDEPKHALVKAVLCERCARKLVYKREKDREARAQAMPLVIDEDVPERVEPARSAARQVSIKQEDEEEDGYGPARPPQSVRDARQRHGRSCSPLRGSAREDGCRDTRRRRSLS